MFEVDRITGDGKKAIIDLVEKAMNMEYSFIVDFPRLIERLATIHHIPSESIPPSLEQLTMDSARHLALAAELTRRLGGQPRWRANMESIVDTGTVFDRQMGKEGLALSLYRQAKAIAEQNQVRGLGGIFWGTRTLGGLLSHDLVTRQTTIEVLEEMAEDEERHITLLQETISALNIQPQK